jgi:rhodanese-related sulfurtransferase
VKSMDGGLTAWLAEVGPVVPLSLR